MTRFGAGLSAESLPLTRREMLALTGTLAVAASGGVNATAAALSAATITSDRHTLAVRVGGRTFTLDARLFGGSPKLTVIRSADGAVAQLTSATYPGTDIPADVTLKFESLSGNARVRVRSRAFGLSATVPLLAWLEGRAFARSAVRLTGIRSAFGDGRVLRLKGAAQATLHADLSLDLTGDDIARLTGPGMAVEADEVHLWLATSSTATSFTRMIRRRTFVQLSEKDAEWQVEGIATGTGNAVAFEDGCFDLATIEAAETGARQRLAVITFENAAQKGTAALKISAGRDGVTPSLLPLGNARYAFVCGDHAAFSVAADVADGTSWVHQPGYSLLVGRHPKYGSVELRGAGGTTEKVDARTQLLALAVPIDGVLASPITVPATASSEEGPVTATVAGSATTVDLERVTAAAAPPGYVADATSVRLTRPEDMLSIKLEFFNLVLQLGGDIPLLVRKSLSKPSYIVAEFPPQHLLERAFYAESGTLTKLLTWLIMNPKTPPIAARLAEPTRLAFRVPDYMLEPGKGIPYTLEGLLDWMPYSNSVAPYASNNPPRNTVTFIPLRKPAKGTHYPLVAPETSIEAPWGLYLSPSENREYWKHRTYPFTPDNGVTELWHTTMTGRMRRTQFGLIPYKTGIRTVWARGYRGFEPAPDISFRNSFTTSADDPVGHQNRWALVDITARYQHDRVDVKRLTLSPLGAWMDLKGQWPTDEYMVYQQIASPLLAWEHRATMARDQFVKIVIAGRLFPFGHKAALITITERKFQDSPEGRHTAYLIQRSFIIVRELERSYSFGATARTRQTPFRTVTLKTRVTPDLMANVDTLVDDPQLPIKTQNAFWPHVLTTTQPFNFRYVTTDWDGRTQDVSSPLIFIEEDWAVKTADPPEGEGVWREINICARAMADMEVDLRGQKVAYSEDLGASPPVDPATGAVKDRRVLQTEAIRFTAENAVSTNWNTPGAIFFYPKLHRAQVRLEDVEALMGNNSGTWIKPYQTYLDHGYGGDGGAIDNSAGRVFAEISDSGALSTTPPPGSLALNVPPDKTGGLATPSLAVTGLSATEGAFGGPPADFGTGEIAAEDFFDQMNPKLFGDIRLLDILQGIMFSLTDGDVPNFNDNIIERGGQKFARYDYKWETTKFGTSEFFQALSSPQTKLTLNAFVEKNLSDITATPQAGVVGDLIHFNLRFFVIEVQFNYFHFDVDSSGKVNVDPSIEDIRFYNELEFINQLRDLMNFTSDDGGFAIDVTGSGVSAIITIALPDVAVGIFSLKNMSITAGIKIPFTGEPVRFPFSFCTPEKPFEISVSGFGGGGYFLIELQASDENRVAVIEFSLEFGVCCSVSLCGIASGSVEIKGGVMMRFELGALTFKAFFRMAGRLDVLGIIAVGVTFDLSLTYMNKQAAGGPNEILIGEASLTIDIEILFFSFSVTLTVTKQFEGDDPKFGDWMDADEWATYCNAFGPATVGA